MTVLEAFRNRALWVPERENPIYRVEYISDGHSGRVIISVEAPETAKEELQKQWEHLPRINGFQKLASEKSFA